MACNQWPFWRFVVVRPFIRRDGFSKIWKDYPLSNQAISSCFSLIFNVIHLAKWECKHKFLAKLDFLISCLLGETGTGKTRTAKFDPQLKPSKERSVIAVNCAGLAGSLRVRLLISCRVIGWNCLERIEQVLFRNALAINNNNQNTYCAATRHQSFRINKELKRIAYWLVHEYSTNGLFLHRSEFSWASSKLHVFRTEHRMLEQIVRASDVWFVDGRG